MLLAGKLFIPTIDTLRRDDPAEATALCRLTKKRFGALTKQDRECLLSCALQAEISSVHNNAGESPRIFANIWRREIGKR